MPHVDDFLSKPLEFMRTHALSPPDGVLAGGRNLKSWTVPSEQIRVGGSDGPTTDIKLVTGPAGVQLAGFSAHPIFPGALTLDLAPAALGADPVGRVPIHWLPWGSLRVVTQTIPELKRNDTDLSNPQFFFTAGINGCSVFVKGPPTSPTVSHAGIDGKLSGKASDFWRQQMRTAMNGAYFEQGIVGEVERDQYMVNDRQVMLDYIRWAQSEGSGGQPFTVEVTSSFGCVFGIRYGRNWSFYLQEAAVLETARFVKRSAVSVSKDANGSKIYNEKATGFGVSKQTITTPRAILPDRTQRIYASVNKRAVPVKVGEIFPGQNWSRTIQDTVRQHAM